MKVTFKIWMLIFFLLLSLIAIAPWGFLEKGVLVKSVGQNSSIAEAGLKSGEVIKEVNGQQITSMKEYSDAVSSALAPIRPESFDVKTSEGEFEYNSLTLDFAIDENLTITSITGNASLAGIALNSTISSVNGEKIESLEDFTLLKSKIEPKAKLQIKTNVKDYSFLTNSIPDITISEVPASHIKAGLDLSGGARALVKPERKLTQDEMRNLISVSNERFNVYGISDVVVRGETDLSGNNYMVVEVAGATSDELKELVGKQGKFEAKIGNETIFIGGKKHITSVCQNNAQCAGIRECNPTQDGYYCTFEFIIYLSEEAAKKQADVTSTLGENITASGSRVLSKNLDLYLDDQPVDSLQIDADLKGKTATQISIRGSGFGATKADAFKSAEENMAKLQTVLITGSLPFKLEIVKLDTISPLLGKEFVNNVFFAGFLSLMGVSALVFARYKKLKLALPVILTVISEIVIILGASVLFNWRLDLASIAGIVAVIGTGVNAQIIILDESGKTKSYSLKDRIKGAFFMIFSSFATAFVAMVPLLLAGAGLIRGFALTTMIGIVIGVSITRPAFADIVNGILKE